MEDLKGKTPYEMMMEGQWDWKQVVYWYDNALNELTLPDDAKHTDMQKMDNKVDFVYRIFRKDYARILERSNKVARRIKKVTTKETGNSKSTNSEKRKADGIAAAESHILDPNEPPIDLYGIEDTMLAYVEFFEYLKDVLERKTGLLNRVLGSNKIDGWLTR